MKDKPGIFEWAVFTIFIVLEIVLVTLRFNSPASETSQAENVLFSTFEIVFSLYIGYFVQRIDSTKQFQESLKQYGLSAYRRIMDIRKSVDRTIIQIERISKNYPREKLNEIDALRLILEGTFDTVESSILDWGDIIGPEIKKKERAELLQDELEKTQEKINLSSIDRENIEKLTIELNKINSELPLALKSGNTNIDLDSEKRIFYSNYIESVINSDKYLNLHILLNDSVSIEGIENAFNSQSFYCLMSENICFIFNRNDTLFGRLENPIGSEADLKYYLQELQTLFYWLHLHDSDEQRKYLQAVFKLENLKYVRSIENSKTVIVQLPYDSDFFYSPRG